MPHNKYNAAFLIGTGDMRARMQELDWSGFTAGSPVDWSPELIFVVRLMLDSAFPTFIAWGNELTFLYNDAYARILGAKHPWALGRNFPEVWPEIWDEIHPIVQKALNGQSSFYEDLPLTVLRHGYAEPAWFTFSYSPIYLASGSIGGMHCTVNESTDKVLATKRQAFRIELTEKLRTARSSNSIIEISTLLLGIFLGMDRVWYAEVNEDTRSFQTRNMWTSRELPTIPLQGSIDQYGPALLDKLRRGLPLAVANIALDPYLGSHVEQYKALAIGSILIVPLIKDGKLVTNLNLSKVSYHNWSEHEIEAAGYVAEYAWAMIERAQAEQARWESELRYGKLIDIVDEGFAIVELIYASPGLLDDYRFLEVNPAFEKQSGMVSVTGKTIKELTPNIESFWIELVARVARTGTPERIEHQARSTGRWFSMYASRLEFADTGRAAILFNDITSRKQNEEDLRLSAARLSEADRRKTEFLATLAHELRNPLAPLRTGLEVMRLASSPQAIAQVRDMMGRQITHMVRLIEDLLDIARISSGKVVLQKELTDLRSVISLAVETSLPLIESSRHQLTVQIPDETILLDIDSVRIEQAIGNLLTNAAKYTPPGGHIELSVQREAEYVRIGVHDDGIGIPEDALPIVFDMFAQVEKSQAQSRGGLGIGLAIVHRLAELHGGSVMVQSPGIDQGSTFTLQLPLPIVAPEAVPNLQSITQQESEAVSSSLSILVADDNKDAASMLASLLSMQGHIVTIANDGCQALRMASEQKTDVVILDIGMPGMTGYEVARELRTMSEMDMTILIALTGWGTVEDKARTLSAGFDYHITKPVELSALNEILCRVGDYCSR